MTTLLSTAISLFSVDDIKGEKEKQTHAVKFLRQRQTHQLLEQMPHGDLVVPALYAGQQGIVELFVDLEDVLDFVEDGLYLLHGQDGLGGRGCGFQGTHGLRGKELKVRGRPC